MGVRTRARHNDTEKPVGLLWIDDDGEFTEITMTLEEAALLYRRLSRTLDVVVSND